MNFSQTIFVDPSITTAGDGSTPAAALKDLPAIDALADDTMYLIRRTGDTAFCNVPAGSNSTVTRIGIIGMPQSDDGLFGLMPEAARTAWGADTAERAQLRVASSDCQLSGCYDFFLWNVNLERTEAYSGYYGAFYFTNTANKCGAIGGKADDSSHTYYGKMSIVNCRFAGAGEDLDAEDATSLSISGKGQNYLYHEGYVSEMSIRNNIFCFSPSSSSYGTSCLIYCNRIEDNINIAGNRIYSVTTASSEYGGGYYFFYFYNSSTAYTTCRVVDNSCVIYPLQSSGGAFPTFLQMYDNGTNGLTEVRDFSYASAAAIGGNFPSQLSVGTVLEFHTSAMGVFENISIDLPKCWKTTSDVIHIECNQEQGYNNGFSKIDGISVTMADDGIGEKTSDADLFETESQYYKRSALRLQAAYTPISNISVWNPHGAALMVQGSLACENIGGVVTLYNGGYQTIKKLTCFRKYALFVRGGDTTSYYQYNKATAVVDEVIMNEESAEEVVGYTPHNQQQYMRSARVFVGTSNVLVRAVTGALSGDGGNTANGIDAATIVCPNNGQVGRFSAMGNLVSVDTWAAGRGNSEGPVCLRFTNNTGHTRAALPIGFAPNRIVVNSSLAAGKHTATIYFASSGFSNIKDQFYVEYHTSNGTVSTLTEGILLDDDSEWTGVSEGVQAQKIVCPITTTKDGELSATLYFRGYSADSLLVDTGIVIE